MTVIWIFAVLLLFVILAVLVVTVYLYRYGLSRYPFPHSPRDPDVWAEEPKPRKRSDGTPYDPYGRGEWVREADLMLYSLGKDAPRFTITSHDGLTLAARYIAPEGTPRGIVLMVHGYRSSPMCDFTCGVCDMRPMGFGCLLIEQRAHLTSEGDTITFGVKERYDVLDWARFLEEKFPGTPVIFDGLSMGGATVMMAAGLDLPGNVRGIIADCGYTSMQDMFEIIIKKWFHLPAWPFIPLASLYCRLKNGFGFGDVTSQDCLVHAKVPVLMAHGTDDTFVPYEMGERIYSVVRDKIDVTFIAAEGAGHGLSFVKEYDTYHAALISFFDKCLKSE